MMAEKTDIKFPKKHRQSKEYPDNFSREETKATFVSTGNINENQKQEKCSAGWDKRTSEMILRNDSISSVHSCHSGYASGKFTDNSVVFNFENEEEK